MNKKSKKILIFISILFLVVSGIFSNVKLINATTTKLGTENNGQPEILKINSWFTFVNEPQTIGGKTGSLVGMTKYVFEVTDSENVKHYTNTINYIWSDANNLYYSVRIYDTFLKDYNSYDIKVYNKTEGWLNQDCRYIFVTSTTSVIKSYLDNNGVWDLVSSIPESSLSDMIYAVVDVIPKTIQSMTSVEILGTTLFAILGTIVLIMVIVKIVGTIG